jgi:hypothetical protein
MALIEITDPQIDPISQIGLAIRGAIAVCPTTGAELHASHGRRIAGQPRRYMVLFPIGETYTVHGQGGAFVRQRLARAFSLTAHNDADAIARANQALARFLHKPRRWDTARWRFVADDTV